MALWWIFLIGVLFPKVFAQKNCGRPRVELATPVFGAGENLSSENCGKWKQHNEAEAPWKVFIKAPGNSRRMCYGTLISPTSVLTDGCKKRADDFARSTNKNRFMAELGKCCDSDESEECERNGLGQVVQVLSVTRLNASGIPRPLYIWKIQKVNFKEDFISPICISNAAMNQDHSEKMLFFTVFDGWWQKDKQEVVSYLGEFYMCLRESKKFKTCDKLGDHIQCVRMPNTLDWSRPFLTYKKANRYFLHAIEVEINVPGYKYYYEIAPLMEQIFALSGDILGHSTRANEA